jgi:putative FmdB family regulatory protein
MPFYEYQCQACGKQLESLQKISDPPLVDCPACGKPALEKKISAAGFRLTGGGWYVTDFKDKGKAKDKASAPEGSASTDTKADSAAPKSSTD